VRRGNGGVSLASEGGNPSLLVGKVFLCGIALERAGAAFLQTVIEWLEVGFRDGN